MLRNTILFPVAGVAPRSILVTGALPTGKKAGVALTDGSLSAMPGTDVNDCKSAGDLVSVGLGQIDCVELYGSPATTNGLGISQKTALSDDQWAAARVDAGIPDIDVRNTEKYTPHMLNLDLLDAIHERLGWSPDPLPDLVGQQAPHHLHRDHHDGCQHHGAGHIQDRFACGHSRIHQNQRPQRPRQL